MCHRMKASLTRRHWGCHSQRLFVAFPPDASHSRHVNRHHIFRFKHAPLCGAHFKAPSLNSTHSFPFRSKLACRKRALRQVSVFLDQSTSLRPLFPEQGKLESAACTALLECDELHTCHTRLCPISLMLTTILSHLQTNG